jgi:hypothetical protein
MRWAKLNPARITLAAGAVSLNKATHDGAILILSALTGHTVTLPPAAGAGTRIRMVSTVAPTSNSNIVKVQNAIDVMVGSARTSLASGVGTNFPTAATSDTITANRTTTGGASNGEFYEFIDVAPGIWTVQAWLNGSGILATPFSATVS